MLRDIFACLTQNDVVLWFNSKCPSGHVGMLSDAALVSTHVFPSEIVPYYRRTARLLMDYNCKHPHTSVHFMLHLHMLA